MLDYFSLVTLPITIIIVVTMFMNFTYPFLEWSILSPCEFHLCSQVSIERILWQQSSCPCHPLILLCEVTVNIKHLKTVWCSLDTGAIEDLEKYYYVDWDADLHITRFIKHLSESMFPAVIKCSIFRVLGAGSVRDVSTRSGPSLTKLWQ